MKNMRCVTIIYFIALLLCSSCSTNEISFIEVKNAVADSDDFSLYENAFINSTYDLIKRDVCSLKEVLDQGGWIKSVNNKEEPLYFIYCGGSKQNDKIYLNVETGSTTK